MKTIVCISGTRPQLIKHSVLYQVLQKHFTVISLYTGQHYDYELHEGLKKELFQNHPFHNLVLDEMLTPAHRLADMIQKIAAFLQQAWPDAILVYGDTDTTLAGALAANKMNIPLVHVEAGERGYNHDMPEEHNRIVTDALSDVLFCASKTAADRLHAEGNKGAIWYCGDLMKDLLLQTAKLFQTPIVEGSYVICTIHRNYTKQDEGKLKALLDVLGSLDHTVIFPVHPATRATIDKLIINKEPYTNIRFLGPVSYKDSIRYQKFAVAIITDSGGIQKEAYWLQRRCITVRKETEWTDTLLGNWNQVVYDDLSTIPGLLCTPLGDHDALLYGDGTATTCIVNHLKQLL